MRDTHVLLFASIVFFIGGYVIAAMNQSNSSILTVIGAIMSLAGAFGTWQIAGRLMFESK